MNLDQLRDSDPWTWEIVAAKPRVAARPRRSSARQWGATQKSRPRRRANVVIRGLTPNREGLMAMMMPEAYDRNPPARRSTSAASVTIARPTGTHWYVDNAFGPGYCAACNCPRENRRHVERGV